MDDNELQSKFKSLPSLFIFMGTADDNTIPATQGGALAWRLKNMGIENWRMFVYKGASHVIHRLKEGVPRKAFREIFTDILSIAQGNPREGTKDLSALSNGNTKINDSTMREKAQGAKFIKVNDQNEIETISFEETECGKVILAETEQNDLQNPQE
jgi:hypothetical protein